MKRLLEIIKKGFTGYFQGFIKGDWITKVSYIVMGFGSIARKQFVRGFIYLGLQLVFFYYMATTGLFYLSKFPTLGTVTQGQVWDEVDQIYRYTKGDNSLLILLFGVVTITVIIGMLVVYFVSVNNSLKNEKLLKEGKRLPSIKEDINDLLDQKFYISVLSIPLATAFMFTVLPLIFMILMAFTNFDRFHQPPGNLFTWVGLQNFVNLFGGNATKSTTFFHLLAWTIVWAIFATFLNYVGGMVLAILINKKGIKLKKMWRTIFITTIAVPQFVSLLLMSKLLHDQGAINVLLLNLGWIDKFIPFLSDPNVAKVTIIVVNLWVGIPYSMLITSGILMNIPADLYESAQIDGAGPVVQFMKITLPYMLFVTGPYLITQFIGNINNFNVIYLLTAGGPVSLKYYQAGGTDLLVTWLYKLTVNEQDYALASTVGILIFLLCAFFSLVVFNKSSAMSSEDDFQ